MWKEEIRKKVRIKQPKVNRCPKCGEPFATFMGVNTGLCENPACSEYNPSKLMEMGFETYPRIKKAKQRFQLSQGVREMILVEIEEVILKLAKNLEVIKNAKEEGDRLKEYLDPEFFVLGALDQEIGAMLFRDMDTMGRQKEEGDFDL